MQESVSYDPFLRGKMSREAVDRGGLPPYIEIQIGSVPSAKHPDRNEDAFFVIPNKAVGVFDGMGGHAAGDRASTIARNVMFWEISSMVPGSSLPSTAEMIQKILKEANQAVYQQATKAGNDMGTTASVVYIWEGPEGERRAIVVNVGDSRVYLQRRGRVTQITLDDSYVRLATQDENEAYLLQSKLNNVTDPQRELTPEEMGLFACGNVVTQALGQREVHPRVHIVPLEPGDRLMVCSDGISDNLTDNEILGILNANPDNAKAVQALIAAAQRRSRTLHHPRAKADDMTVAIIWNPVKGAEEPPKTERSRYPLEIGSRVVVQTPNGKFEWGWTVTALNRITGVATVTKPVGNDYLQRKIPLAKLQRLNTPPTIQTLLEAENPEELVYLLDRFPEEIQGSQRSYTGPELAEIVRNVIINGAPLETVTRACGLRKKVEDLLKRNLLKRKKRSLLSLFRQRR